MRKQRFRKRAGGEGTGRGGRSEVAGGACGVEASRSAAAGLFACRPGGAGGGVVASLGRLLAGNLLSSTPNVNTGAGCLFSCGLSDVHLLISGRKKNVCVCVAQLCPILCDPMDCSLPGSSVQGILQTRIPEWVAIPFSRGSSRPRE